MRILLVSELVLPVRGGLEIHVGALASSLGARGHEVAIATLTANPLPSSNRVYSVRGLAHHLPHIDANRPFHAPLPDPLARRQLAAAIDEFKPDVVHAHNWLSVSVPHRRTDPPIVLTMHDYSLVCQLRTLFDANEKICDGPNARKCLDCGSRQTGKARARIMGPATALGRRLIRPQSIVAVSNAVAAAVQPHVHHRIEVVPNFVGAPAEPQPLPQGFPEGEFALYAGDLGPHKGVGDLLKAWTSSAPAGLTLVLAGTRAGTAKLPETVYRTSLSPGQMTSAWQRACLSIIPSRWADPCPTVALEALQAGVPVVATRVGGIPDIITDGVTGALVPPDSPDQLGAAILRLWEDGGLRTRMSEAAILAAKSFTEDAVVPRIADIYARAVRRLDVGKP